MKYPNNARILLILGVGATLFFGCHKEDASPGTPVPPVASVNPLLQVFASHRANAVQHFTINTDNGPGQVNGADGFYGIFGQHAFRKADGSTASGNIDVGLVEAFRVGDMLWLNTQTVGIQNGQQKLLVSGGQFRITATQNGEPLSLAPNSAYFGVPNNSSPDPEMSVFSGNLDALGSMTWTEWPTNPIAFTDTTVADTTFMDSIPLDPGFYYGFPSDSMNWINCDYFYDSPGPLTGITVECPTGYDHSNTLVWIVFPDINSMIGAYAGIDNVFSSGGGYEMPVGINVTVVALAEVDGAYFSSFTDAVVTAGMNLNITLDPTTLEQFEVDAGGL